MMSSVIPAIMTALQTRLRAITGVKTVYRALQGYGHPTDLPASDLPAIALRISGDTIESAKLGKARVQVRVDVDYLLNVVAATTDADLANALFAMRQAIGVDEDPPLNGLLRQGTGVEWGESLYGYPDPGSQLALVRQSIAIHCIENYSET